MTGFGPIDSNGAKCVLSAQSAYGDCHELVSLRALESNTIGITLMPNAANADMELETSRLLSRVLDYTFQPGHFSRLLIDFSCVSKLPDEARGPVVGLIIAFSKRNGAIICGACRDILQIFETMQLNKLYSHCDSIKLSGPSRESGRALVELERKVKSAELDDLEMRRADSRRNVTIRELAFNGNMLTGTVVDDMAFVRLNSEITKLSEDAGVAERVQESLEAIYHCDPQVSRILVDLNGLQHLGATSIGVLISLYKNALEGHGPRIALCGAEPEVANVFKTMQLDKLLKIFSTSDEALAANW